MLSSEPCYLEQDHAMLRSHKVLLKPSRYVTLHTCDKGSNSLISGQQGMTWQQDGESPDTFDERGEIANRLSEASKYFGDQKIKNAKGKNPETPAPNTTIRRTSATI